MAARKRTLRSNAKARQLLRLLTMEAQALQHALDRTEPRVYLLANLLADLSTECRRGIETIQIARNATTIEEARRILTDYLTSLDK